MAQGQSVAFFTKFQSKFNSLCTEFDSSWVQRRRTLNTRIIVLLLWKLVSGEMEVVSPSMTSGARVTSF